MGCGNVISIVIALRRHQVTRVTVLFGIYNVCAFVQYERYKRLFQVAVL